MNRTKIVGLTGGIGSGKSTVARRWKQLGASVLDADFYSRHALDPGTECYEKTAELFGEKCIRPDGTMDRAYIAARIFTNLELRASLNAIIHPYVLRRMISETERCEKRWVVWEVPLLFESGFDAYCDLNVAVLCDESIRVERIMARDGSTREHALARIRSQMNDAERRQKADAVLENDSDLAALICAADALYRTLEERL